MTSDSDSVGISTRVLHIRNDLGLREAWPHSRKTTQIEGVCKQGAEENIWS